MYQSISATTLSQFLQGTTYPFAITEVVHLIGVAMFLGATVTVCLKFLGLGIPKHASAIYQGIRTWTWISLGIVATTGLLMVIGEPVKLSNSEMWASKLGFLGAGLALHLLAYLPMLKPGRAEAHPRLAKLLAILLLGCWIIVGFRGRMIGFE